MLRTLQALLIARNITHSLPVIFNYFLMLAVHSKSSTTTNWFTGDVKRVENVLETWKH